MRASPSIVAFVAAVVTMTVAADAEAFCRSTTCSGECERDVERCKIEGMPLYWPGLCVSFSLNAQGSAFVDFADFERIAAASAAAWSDVPCDGGGAATISFVRTDDVQSHVAEYDQNGPNANIIMFQDTKWKYTGIDNTLAKTTVTYDTDTGEILDADIELNHAYNEFTTGDEDVNYDLQSILTHEMGHFIGLDHTEDLSATMNAGYSPGSIDLRAIDYDDELAACAAYPPEREVVCRPEPNGGFLGDFEEEPDDGCTTGAIAPASKREGALWLGVAALAALATRRRSS